MPYPTVYHMVVYQLGAKLKRSRPSHAKKKPGARVAFLSQLPFKLRLSRRRLDPSAQKRVRLWSMDEARFSLISDLGRRITLRGIKPVASISYRRENF